MKLLIINGPNLNFLGIREPEIYGSNTYSELCDMIKKHCNELKIDFEIFQSNHEGALIDKIQESFGSCDGIVINPAAYTHTSIAIADALKAVNLPTVEVHISDIDKREDFRKTSYIKDACICTVAGLGFNSYIKALDILTEKLK